MLTEENIIRECDWEICDPIQKTDGYIWVVGFHKETGAKYEATAEVFHSKIIDIITPIMACD